MLLATSDLFNNGTQPEKVMDLSTVYKPDAMDLGRFANDPRLDGIWVRRDFDPRIVEKYIHAAFREKAEEYAQAHQHIDRFEQLFRRVFDDLRFWNLDAPVTILDVGAGAGGNTVIPLLRILPRAEIIAGDLSVELLTLLKQALDRLELRNRCTLLQLNVEELAFEDESLDLVVGCAILHHLLTPQKTLQQSARILKKNGVAVFFEPFEAGNAYLQIMWNRILTDPRAESIDDRMTAFLRSLSTDWDVRKGRDKSAPRFQEMEDKWLFTRRFFEEQYRIFGFSHCTTCSLHAMDDSLHDSDRPFESQMKLILKEGLGEAENALPDWAWAVIREHEEYFSPDGRQDLFIEGCIILQK